MVRSAPARVEESWSSSTATRGCCSSTRRASARCVQPQHSKQRYASMSKTSAVSRTSSDELLMRDMARGDTSRGVAARFASSQSLSPRALSADGEESIIAELDSGSAMPSGGIDTVICESDSAGVATWRDRRGEHTDGASEMPSTLPRSARTVDCSALRSDDFESSPIQWQLLRDRCCWSRAPTSTVRQPPA